MSTYVSLNEFKTYIRDEIPAVDDTILQTALDAAEAEINDMCQRNFYVAGAASNRTYVANDEYVLRIHDCTAVNSVTFNGTLIDSSTYQVEPVALDWTGFNSPYEQVRRWYLPWYNFFPVGRPTLIVVNATWGWAATPSPPIQLTYQLAKDKIGYRNGVALATAVDAIQPYRRGESYGF